MDNYNSLINDINQITNGVSVYILLDRSGSMSGPKWEHSIGSINSYVQNLRGQKASANITVAAFDSGGIGGIGGRISSLDFNLIRDNVTIDQYIDIDYREINPRGGTPLYDATARLLDLADKSNSDKTVIIIVTDGDENSSIEWSLSSIKDRIKTCQDKNWEVVFLGAEFNIETIAKNYGVLESKVINTSSYETLRDSMNFYADSTISYMSGSSFDTTAVKEQLR